MLALADSVAISVEVLALLLVLRRRWQGIEGRQTLQSLLRVLAATLVMGGVVYGVVWLGERAGLSAFLLVAAGAAAGGLTYLLAAWVLRVEGLRWTLHALTRQVRRG